MLPSHATTIHPAFPALSTHHLSFIFADSAGGAQTLGECGALLLDYLFRTNAQMGSDYMRESTERANERAKRAAVEMFGVRDGAEAGVQEQGEGEKERGDGGVGGKGEGDGEGGGVPEPWEQIVWGMSSTANLEALARGLEGDVRVGEEVIVALEHEANVTPWTSLAARKSLVLNPWATRPLDSSNPYSLALHLSDLLPLITSRTRLVALTACSNILGSVMPVAEIVQAVRAEARSKGARKVEIVLDCVAYAPHRRMAVTEWDVDFAVVSYYKVYGPHISAMYVRSASLASSVSSIIHPFLSDTYAHSGYKLQPGGPGYEAAWATTAVPAYLKTLSTQGTLEGGYAAVSTHDEKLAERLLGYLGAERQWRRGVRVVGQGFGRGRMPTVSFVVLEGEGGGKMQSREVVRRFDAEGKIGIRYGHFYAYSLVKQIRPDDVEDGVVRISFVHYHTLEQVDAVVETLERVLYS